MSDPMQSYPPPPSHSGSNLKTAVLVGAVIAMLAANIYLYMQVDGLKTEISKLRESIATEVTNLRENSSATSDTHRKSIETLKSELEAARRTAATAASHAKVEAESHADKIAKQLADEQKRQAQQVASQISEVKDANTATNTKIADVNSEGSRYMPLRIFPRGRSSPRRVVAGSSILSKPLARRPGSLPPPAPPEETPEPRPRP